MSNWRHARAAIALIAAYAVALQTILLALGIPLAGAATFAAQQICAASGASAAGVGTGSPPADHAHDCLAACLTGCCGGATAALPLRAAIVVAPYGASTRATVKTRVCALQPPVTGSHRSRAPPRA